MEVFVANVTNIFFNFFGDAFYDEDDDDEATTTTLTVTTNTTETRTATAMTTTTTTTTTTMTMTISTTITPMTAMIRLTPISHKSCMFVKKEVKI